MLYVQNCNKLPDSGNVQERVKAMYHGLNNNAGIAIQKSAK